MISRPFCTQHLNFKLGMKFGITQMKKLPLEICSSGFSSIFKKPSTSQYLKLPVKTKSTKVKSDSGTENLDTEAESETSVTETDNLSDKLVHWVMENNITYRSFSRLLKILHEQGFKNLPKNSRNLLQAKEDQISVHEIPPGVYYHFSLEKNLKELIKHLLLKKHSIGPIINISIFIDEILLSATQKDSLWVILGSIVEYNRMVFGVGAYRGSSRPKDSNLFLSNFVKEVGELSYRGLIVNQKNYKIVIKRVICDTPAKAFILNMQSHTGYSSCTKCWAVGEYNKKLCFPNVSDPKTDEDFEKSSMYKSQKTELLKIPSFGIVSNIPLDYMHLVCFGVVRKLLMNLGNKLCMKTISEKIKNIEKLYEFQSKSKSLDMSAWSAAKFRQFLLYYGPVVLQGVLDKKYYDNFLDLHVGCRLLCMDHNEETANLGRTFLNNFIEQYKNLYGVDEMSHNVHGLHHLVDDYINHGTLDSFSSFSFEKFLTKLKRSMKKSKKKTVPQLILKESCSTVFSRSLLELTKDKCRLFKQEKINENYSRFTYLHLSGIRISPLNGDNYVLLKNNKIIKVTEIFKKDKSIFVSGNEFSSYFSFYKKPLDSTKLKFFEVGDLSDVVQTWSVFMIDRKCLKVPINNGRWAMIGLLNES